VVHGGNEYILEQIREVIDYSVINMNVDTDIQWIFCERIGEFVTDKYDYLKG